MRREETYGPCVLMPTMIYTAGDTTMQIHRTGNGMPRNGIPKFIVAATGEHGGGKRHVTGGVSGARQWQQRRQRTHARTGEWWAGDL